MIASVSVCLPSGGGEGSKPRFSGWKDCCHIQGLLNDEGLSSRS